MRYVLALDLKDDESLIATYESYHQPENIWPEIVAGIKAGGINKMDIYRIGNHLIMIVETNEGVDLKTAFEKISDMPRQDEWAKLMDTFQQRLPEAQSDEHWAMMTQIFDLNAKTKL